MLKQVGSRTLSGVRHGANEWVTSRFSTNERMRLVLTVTKNRSTKRLALLKGSILAGTVSKATRLAVTGVASGAGSFGLRAILTRSGLTKGQIYLLHLAATDARGKTTSLAIRFRA